MVNFTCKSGFIRVEFGTSLEGQTTFYPINTPVSVTATTDKYSATSIQLHVGSHRFFVSDSYQEAIEKLEKCISE